VVAALEKKYDLMQQEAIHKYKGKVSVVDNLLQGIASPFTEEIVAKPLPNKFKVPNIPLFTGPEDPTEHLDQYQAPWVMDQTARPIFLSLSSFFLSLSDTLSISDTLSALSPFSQSLFLPSRSLSFSLTLRHSFSLFLSDRPSPFSIHSLTA
jgi:hypothetical protein